MSFSALNASKSDFLQWYKEIEKHCTSRRESKQHGMGPVIKHVAGHRIDSNASLDVLQSADIILTTYGEVLRSYPKAEVPDELVTAKQKVIEPR